MVTLETIVVYSLTDSLGRPDVAHVWLAIISSSLQHIVTAGVIPHPNRVLHSNRVPHLNRNCD